MNLNIKNFLTDFTILNVFNPERLKQQTQENSPLPVESKLQRSFLTGVQMGLKQIILTQFFYEVISRGLNISNRGISHRLPNPLIYAFVEPIFEAIVFQGLVLNGIHLIQKGIKSIRPLQDYRMVQWITSPSATIFCTGAVHAIFQLAKVNSGLKFSGVIAGCARSFLLYTHPIVYMTTGNLYAPMASYVGSSVAILFVRNFLDKLQRM